MLLHYNALLIRHSSGSELDIVDPLCNAAEVHLHTVRVQLERFERDGRLSRDQRLLYEGVVG